eukprot:scaffold9.g3015.t1
MGKLGEILKHPDELVPLLSMYLAARRAKALPKQPGLAFCYGMLNRVSRSFAVVIQQLPEELRDPVCVFYLVLRALDTVEDDMAIPQASGGGREGAGGRESRGEGGRGREGERGREGGGEGGCEGVEHELWRRGLSLDKRYQTVIADICKRMGNGMADFIPKVVKTAADYDLYCHYVAGLVGIGLSQLFGSSGLESEGFGKLDDLSNQMGLFLQKTNIIRDYLEDINEEPAPRMFWPREIWDEYAERLAEFKEPEHAAAAVRCLNHMVLNALSHVDACLEYMERLRDPKIFRFCAIPQVMAIATLSKCYNNHDVFTGVVKMRRGEAAKVMFHLEGYNEALLFFKHYAGVLGKKAQAARDAGADPLADDVAKACVEIQAKCIARTLRRAQEKEAAFRARLATPASGSVRGSLLAMAAAFAAYAYRAAEASAGVSGGAGRVRAYLGVPFDPRFPQLDKLTRFLAIAFLLYALWVATTGRRLPVQ